MNTLTLLSPLSAFLVMFSLGLSSDINGRLSLRSELIGGYWLGVYVAPLLVLLACAWLDLVSAAALIGFVLCILSGSGTSGVALARAMGAHNRMVTARLASGALIALVAMPLIASQLTSNALAVAGMVFIALLLVQWLPWQIGRWLQERWPFKEQTKHRLEQLASLSVLLLILIVAWESLPHLLGDPWITFVALAVVLTLSVASALYSDERLEAMGVVKNLTLVTLVLTQVHAPQDAMTALAAFGAVMYPATWLASRIALVRIRSAASAQL